MAKGKIFANIMAVVLLGGALGGALYYYNFVDKAPSSGAEKGDKCPDFTAKLYEIDGDTFSIASETFTLSEQIGKVTVVNFWETHCEPCVKELPAFNEIQKEYADNVEVLAVVGMTATEEYAAEWMTDKEWVKWDDKSDWVDFSLKFAYLPTETCQLLDVQMVPRTIIVDKSGIIAYEQDGAMSYEQLKEIIDGLL